MENGNPVYLGVPFLFIHIYTYLKEGGGYYYPVNIN